MCVGETQHFSIKFNRKKQEFINLFHSNNLIREEFLSKMLTKCIIMLLAERCRCFSASIFFF